MELEAVAMKEAPTFGRLVAVFRYSEGKPTAVHSAAVEVPKEVTTYAVLATVEVVVDPIGDTWPEKPP
jgi:hypothetical protein